MAYLEVKSPYGGEVLETIKLATKEDIDEALETAHKVFKDDKNHIPSYERVEILEKCMQIMNTQVEELTLLALSEGGKPYVDSKVEVLRAINGVKLAIENMGAFTGTQVAMGHTASSVNRIAYTMKEPIGVVVSISAFNHPLNLAIHQIIPAIAVGCPVIIKPSDTTPLSAIKLVEILYEAGLPKAWAKVIVCDIPEAEYLATHQKVDYLSFIGSAKVGWYLRSKVSAGTRVGLEHGGVAPVIVEPDSDLDELIPSLTKGGFYHAGQVCVSVQRIYIHQDIFDEVENRLSIEAKKLKIGDPKEKDTEVGPLILPREIQRVDAWVKEAIDLGAKLICGGNILDNNCYEATILSNPPKEAKVSMQEVFAPVICLYSYDDIDDAIDEANSLDVSFQSAIFTKNIDKAMYGVKRLNATAVMVNDHTAFRVDWMPFGGANASGLGMGGISHSMQEMSMEKLMIIKSPSL